MRETEPETTSEGDEARASSDGVDAAIEEQRLSSWQRITGALFDPAPTFRDIARQPSWVVALCLILVCGVAVQVVAAPKVDFEQTIRERFEESDREVDAAQVEQAVEMMARFGWVFGVLAALFLQPLGLLVGAFLFWMIFKLMGSELPFSRSWAVVVHAALPTVLVAIGSIVILLLRDSVDAESLQNGLLASNLSHFAPADASPVVTALLATIDFFGLWIFVLCGIGFSVATRLSRSAVWSTVAVLWLLSVGLRVGLTWLGTALGGAA